MLNVCRPSVKYGKIDPGIDTEKPELTPINGTKDFTTDITITPQEPGTKSLCVQTETSLGYVLLFSLLFSLFIFCHTCILSSYFYYFLTESDVGSWCGLLYYPLCL